MKTQYSDFSVIHTIERACLLYNRLTNPSVCRSDREWTIIRKATRKVTKFLNSNHASRYAESENGRYYPL